MGTMSASETVALDSDQIFEILSSRRRRMVLYYLRRHGGSATMNDLAEQIAAWENDLSIDELTSQQRKRVYVSLYQTHLPKLADSNLIDYDADEGDVQLNDRASDIDSFLTTDTTAEYAWRPHYLRLLVLGGTLMALAVLATPILEQFTVILLASAVMVGYLATVAVEYWYHRKQQSEIPAELVPQYRR